MPYGSIEKKKNALEKRLSAVRNVNIIELLFFFFYKKYTIKHNARIREGKIR